VYRVSFDSVLRQLTPLLRVALLVAVGDLLTKQAAVMALAGDDTVYADWLRLTLVHNDAAAFGVSLGAYTFQVNVLVKLGAIFLMLAACRDLARIDRDAPVALGLIVGGALGNLASLLLQPSGVVDFIALDIGRGHELVLNGADIAAYAGLALLGRTVWRVIVLTRSPARAVISQRLARQPVSLRLVGERQIVRNVVVAADVGRPHEDELWLPRQKPPVETVVVTPIFDERSRSMGAIRDDERPIPRVPARVIDMQSRKPLTSDSTPE
jgi:lipoprotein signal peptidase